MINVPDEIFLFIDLLLGNVQEDGLKLWLNLIDKVLSRQFSYEQLTRNVCTIEIKCDVTKIVDVYADEDQKAYYLIETAQLKRFFLHSMRLLEINTQDRN